MIKTNFLNKDNERIAEAIETTCSDEGISIDVEAYLNLVKKGMIKFDILETDVDEVKFTISVDGNFIADALLGIEEDYVDIQYLENYKESEYDEEFGEEVDGDGNLWKYNINDHYTRRSATTFEDIESCDLIVLLEFLEEYLKQQGYKAYIFGDETFGVQ